MSYMGKVRPTIVLDSTDLADDAVSTAKIADDAVSTDKIADNAVTSAKLASGAVDTTAVQDDIALLAFKTQSNGSLARYNLVDQSVDSFEDASGIDASASTNEFRNAAGNYYSGADVATDVAANFTASGTWTTPSNLSGTAKILVVAGGGTGGSSGWTPGGGGAGGLVYVSNYAAAASTSYGVTVGAGGAAITFDNSNLLAGNEGEDSVFDTAGAHQTLTASGGGGGGAYTPQATAGGSGGGGANSPTSQTGHGSAGATDQVVTFGSYSNVGFGFAGGTGYTAGLGTAGGGGGAGSVGEANTSTSRSGNGGSGKDYSSIFGTGVGDDGWFAGGGGASGWLSASGSRGYGNGGSGNKGGGGDGAIYDTNGSSTAGAANTGGGGGSDRSDQNTKAGGSGAVHILYDTLSYDDMTLVSNAQTAQSAPTTGDLVMTYSDGVGTATVNTDIKAYISRDGSAYTSAVTLVSQGTTGGHTILTANGVDLSGITSGTSMRFKITTHNQSAAKDTRIHAVSLGWS